MRSHVFLTPMSPDGKPGELVEVQFNDEGPRQFAEPVSPWAVNDAELSKLRTAVSDAETALRHAISRKAGSGEVSRLEMALTTAKRDLDTVEYELRRQRQRQQIGADSPFSRNEAPTVKNARTFAELVAGVAALVKTTPPAAKKKMTWDEYLADLDERLAKRALEKVLRGEIPARPAAGPAGHGANTCCTGNYLCAKCKAKAAAAA